jgi:hypothetical protein
MERFPAPASKKWVQQFKSRLTLSRTRTYWQHLVHCYPESFLLDAIHDTCGPESLISKIRNVRKGEIAERKKLSETAKELDENIAALERLARTLYIVDPVLAPIMFMPTDSDKEYAELPEPRPTITVGQILMELQKYALALQHYRNRWDAEQASRAPTKKLTRNLALGILFDVFISCAGEPHWREVSDIINAAYFAHGIEDESLTEEAAQKLWSRHLQSSRPSIRH